VRRLGALAVAVLLAVALAGCGRTARDGGGETVPLPSTTPVASTLAASVADSAPASTAEAPGSTADTGSTEAGASVSDDEDPGSAERLADIVSASIEQQGGTLTVHVELARPLDAAALGPDEQIAVGAYLLASPEDVDPFAARVLIDAGQEPRFLFGPWLGKGQPIEGELDGTALTLTVPGLEQGRFRYAQFFAEDPGGVETLPDDAAGVVPINAAR
jgi:hypothetical protein